jgi:hypothetical protein
MKDGEKITTKPGLEKEWEEAVAKNQDGYGHAVVDVTVKACKYLDEGLSCKKAEDKGVKGSGITGFMAGCMAQWITYFHPRGEEFRKYWNKQFGIKEDKKGVVNPAVVTVETK